jgi:DNA-binding GntR family transcriptional regulator
MMNGGAIAVSARQTVAESVYLALKRDITTLRHRPGAALTEQELAALYGSSRVPVREACRRLQQ